MAVAWLCPLVPLLHVCVLGVRLGRPTPRHAANETQACWLALVAAAAAAAQSYAAVYDFHCVTLTMLSDPRSMTWPGLPLAQLQTWFATVCTKEGAWCAGVMD